MTGRVTALRADVSIVALWCYWGFWRGDTRELVGEARAWAEQVIGVVNGVTELQL